VIDFDGTLNAAISEVLGDEAPIVYSPQSGGSTTILGVFTQITSRVFGDDAAPEANITVATLGLQLSQLSTPPQQSDTVQVGTATYVVKNASFDGLGWAYLDLGLQ
jgi:hypothetical protein